MLHNTVVCSRPQEDDRRCGLVGTVARELIVAAGRREGAGLAGNTEAAQDQRSLNSACYRRFIYNRNNNENNNNYYYFIKHVCEDKTEESTRKRSIPAPNCRGLEIRAQQAPPE